MHHHSFEQGKFKKAVNLDQNKICGFRCSSTYRNTGVIINQMDIKDEKTPVETTGLYPLYPLHPLHPLLALLAQAAVIITEQLGLAYYY